MQKIIFSACALIMLSSPAMNNTQTMVQRLHRHVTFLQKINSVVKKPVIVPVITVEAVPPCCKHELMRWCLQKIHDEQCIDVAFDVWRAFTSHSTDVCAEDCVFVHDFSALLYVVYMNIMSVKPRANLYDFMVLYTHVSELPIEELLDILDVLYDRIGLIFAAYASTSFSYTTAIKEYWWVPVAVIIAVGVKVLRWYSRRL